MARSSRAMTIGENGSIHSPIETPRAVFGHHPVELLIVLVMRHSLELLACESKADGEHSALGAELCQRAIIEARPIADTVAARIESEERHDENIRLRFGPITRRFKEAEAAGNERAPGFVAMKFQRLSSPRYARQSDFVTSR